MQLTEFKLEITKGQIQSITTAVASKGFLIEIIHPKSCVNPYAIITRKGGKAFDVKHVFELGRLFEIYEQQEMCSETEDNSQYEVCNCCAEVKKYCEC